MRMWRIEAWMQNPIAAQREVLQDLVTSAQYTEFGRKYDFPSLFNIRDLKKQFPYTSTNIKPYTTDHKEQMRWNTPSTVCEKSTLLQPKFIPYMRAWTVTKAAKDVDNVL
jgi:hypothetical protein